MTGLVEIGRLNAATDETMAYEINRPSRSQSAVDARIAPVASDIINSDPAIKQAAKNAIAGAVDDAGLLKQSELGAVRTISTDDSLYVEVQLTRDFRRIGGRLVSGGRIGDTPGVIETITATGDGTVRLSRDFRRVIDLVPETWQAFTAVTGWGDSMTTDHGGLGTNQTVALADALSVAGYDRGISGDTPYEIAWRMGALAWRATVPGGTIPVSGKVPVVIEPANGHNQARTWECTVVGDDGENIHVRISHAATTPSAEPAWEIEQVGGTTPASFLPGSRIRYAAAPLDPAFRTPATFWVGRNDAHLGRVIESLTAMLSQHRDPARRRLVRPIFNRTTEPAGSPGYVNVMAINDAIKELAGPDFFDDRAALIAHGLEIAGITPTPDDDAAVAEDRIPPSLLMDALHLNVAGRLALARIDAIEISGRNW